MSANTLVRFLVLICCGLTISVSGCAQKKYSFDPQLVADVQTATVSFDLANGQGVEAFDALVDTAQIVCLGESHHGIHEQFVMKSDMVKRLVTVHGYRTFIIEESVARAAKIDDWLQTGEGDMDALVSGTTNWFIWDCEEMRSLLKWMYDFNAASNWENPIRLYGADITDPLPSGRIALEYLSFVDAALAEKYKQLLQRLPLEEGQSWEENAQAYKALSPEQTSAVYNEMEAFILELYPSREEWGNIRPDEEWSEAVRNVITVFKAHQMYAAMADDDIALAGKKREAGQMQNISWLHKPEERGGTIYWAHNLHAGLYYFYMDAPGQPRIDEAFPAAFYVKKSVDQATVSFGFSCSGNLTGETWWPGRPTMQGIDGLFRAASIKQGMVVLGNLQQKSMAREWFGGIRQSIGMQGGTTVSFIPSKMFHAMIHIDEATRVAFSKSARERMQE